MNIFIDLGCYSGDSVEQFRNWRKVSFPDKEDWVIHAFDANPKFLSKWETMKDENTHFYLKAAWTEDTTLSFAVDSEDEPLGSTLMQGKKKIWDNNEKIEVEAFNFSEWLKQFENDYVIIKMDIEGAEFPLLNKMVADNTITIPAVLLVEFHPNKVVEYTTTDKIHLMKKIKDLGVDIKDWH